MKMLMMKLKCANTHANRHDEANMQNMHANGDDETNSHTRA
jgi:hypothetical protein